MPNLLSILALVLNALVWGVSWWPFRQLHAAGLHPLWATALMYALALVCLLLARPQALRTALAQVRHAGVKKKLERNLQPAEKALARRQGGA